MAAHIKRFRRENRERAMRLRSPRHFRDRSNPLEELDSAEVFERFRFRPDSILYIMGLILPSLRVSKTKRNMPLPPLLQLLVALRFFATGAVHILVADSVRVSRQTASRCIHSVADALCNLSGQFIKFPTGDVASKTKDAFFKLAGFPNVLGCIDCTHVRILKPSQNEVDFVNRKGFHSLNVQMVCDANFMITSINASWPGSVHDSRIFRSSALCAQFENGTHNGFLLGDSGYQCRQYLMTPLLNPTTPAENKYNLCLCRTRVMVEQTFGVIKRRFQVLQTIIRSSPVNGIKYVGACGVLHNIGVQRRDIVDRETNAEENINAPVIVAEIQDPTANATRQLLIRQYFS